MSQIGAVNYHVHKPFRQAFEIDAGGIVGNLVSPELSLTEVAVLDQRESGVAVDFARDGFDFARSPTSVEDFETGNWQDRYNSELTDFFAAGNRCHRRCGF